MGNRRAIHLCLGLFVAAVTAALCGCAKQPEQPVTPRREEPVVAEPAPPVAEATDPKPLPVLPPPKPGEINEAVARVFKNAALVETSRKPHYLVGDFNGDASQDLAVIIKPAQGGLTELNGEYPPWMIRDPFHPNLPPQLRKEPLRVEEKDVLLAVIHGYGPNGWRNPEATQTYLLKGAVGEAMRMQPAKGSIAENKGKKVPKIFGDTIAEVLGGASGILYYTGAGYAWYDPKTFVPEMQQRMAHPGIAAKR